MNMGSTIKTTLASAALIFAASCSQAVSEPAGKVSTTDKAAIEKIVHEYLVANPEVLVEAFQALEAKQELAEAEQKKQFLPAFLALENAPILGDKDAPITIVEFFDYNCGFCKKSTDWVMTQVASKDVKVIFMELPVLDSRTKTSALAARASVAASMQDKYKELHIAMMKANGLTKGRILSIAEKEGLDVQQLSKDMESATVYRLLEDTMKLAEQADILATPSFYVNGKFVSGANFPMLDKYISEARG
ncbi:DsbA family protein [Hirschia baltica]|uniref:DSBA oxidoreductase n=1 Tax=Hirschia baltica (strain ATCC 49814 / DSM 5838 / IFAM 1418) TaxID=582402 RepID=C6XKL6_HIRBI|nr:thioredoxin domain-containing protein [Hirschia baltica]ACT59583.1 DSBA oxidoreductase [Hirschia baltica ATCC 49814]